MRRIFFLTALLCLGGLLFLNHWAESIRKAPDPRATLKVLDRQGILLAESQNQRFGRRDWVSLSAVSPALVEAVIAQEDRRFFSHFGSTLGPGPRPLGQSSLLALFPRRLHPHPANGQDSFRKLEGSASAENSLFKTARDPLGL
jgi:hypothetical protein